MKPYFCQNRFLSNKSRGFFDRRKLHLSTVGERLCLILLLRIKIWLLGLQIGLERECGGGIWIIKKSFLIVLSDFICCYSTFLYGV